MRAGVTGGLKQIDADVLRGEVIDRQPLLLQHQHHGAAVGNGCATEHHAHTTVGRHKGDVIAGDRPLPRVFDDPIFKRFCHGQSSWTCVLHQEPSAAPRCSIQSSATTSSPPKMALFLRNCVRCCWRFSGSSISQKRCPAAVVGTIDTASARAASRDITPAARSTPAPSWTAAFRRTASSGSVGATGMAEATRSTTGFATFARGSGFASTSSPDTMKTPATNGPAIVRDSLTNPLY